MVRALQRLGLADIHGGTQVPLFVLNVTYPLVPEVILAFCAVIIKRDFPLSSLPVVGKYFRKR